VNDNSPKFINKRKQIEVKENEKNGTEISTFNNGDSWATDPDLAENGTVVFEIYRSSGPGIL